MTRLTIVHRYAVLLLGVVPLVAELLRKLAKREFGSDLLAGIPIGEGLDRPGQTVPPLASD